MDDMRSNRRGGAPRGVTEILTRDSVAHARVARMSRAKSSGTNCPVT